MSEVFCPHCMGDAAPGEQFCPSCGRELELHAESHQLPVGSVLRSQSGHRYLFGKVKGSGGFGMTYIGKELGSGRVVAVKEYYPLRCQPQRLPDASVVPVPQLEEAYRQGMHSFLSEASMLHAVRGIPSIVHVLDYFEANNTAYMVMEYLDGTTLADLMQTQNRFEPTLLLQKMLPLMRDLERLHESGVLHRDIAPDNIMLMPDGSLKLLDFGCARSLEDGRSMTVLLKPGFAPIEQYQTRGQGPFTDIYALCATVYYCLTGKVPPAAPERLTVTFDGGTDPLQPPSAFGTMPSGEQEQLLLWGLSLQPAVRPQSMAQLAEALGNTLSAEPAAAPVAPTPFTAQGSETLERLKRFLKKYRLQLLLALACVVIVLLLIFR